MPDPTYLCPDCGFNELRIEKQGLVGPDGESLGHATCPNCVWEGPLRATIGVLTTEQLWTSERIGELMLRLLAKHAAGPMVQAYEFIGVLPKMRHLADECPPSLTPNAELAAEIAAHNAVVQACRDHVLRETITGAISAGFTAAQEANAHYTSLVKPEARTTTASSDRIFGGDEPS